MTGDELEKLKELLAEAEDLCIEFAGEMRMEAQRVAWELQWLSKEIRKEQAAKQAAQYYKP
jgi:hypothetical protein